MLTLIPWRKTFSPAEDSHALSSLRRELDPWFGSLFDGAWSDGAGDPLRLEVRESAEHYLVRAEIPGLDPKELDIQLQGELLVLSGEKREEARDERESCSYSERRFGAFRRVVRLPMAVDPERVTAEHKNGVVTIRLEKTAAAKPKRITVTGG